MSVSEKVAARRKSVRGPRLGQVVEPESNLLHEFFERSVRRFSHRVAIETPPSTRRPNRRTIAYGDLDRQANALATHLASVMRDNSIVAVLLPRDCELLYLAQLAILKAGAAYTCIDPSFPEEQVRFILEDSRAVALLTDARGKQQAAPWGFEAVEIVDVFETIPKLPPGPLRCATPPWLTPDSLAYVIYTSGTTGRPKGVMIEHRNIANLVRGDLAQFDTTSADRVGQNSSCSYDSSVEEIWFALAAGATLVVMDEETTRLGPDLVGWLKRERVTIFCPPPTLLRSMTCPDPEKELPCLRRIHVGGESLSADLACHWSRGRQLINDYGPTETSVTALRGRILPDQPVTIGKPVPGGRAWVLNENLEELPSGVQGELCIGGAGLARGYLNQPALTAEKFIEHSRLGRIYRTGDLVHRDDQGNYFCHGRMDSQVKVRGYRIELEAIEAFLSRCEGVLAAGCRTQGQGGQQRIIAFVVPRHAHFPPSFVELKTELRKHLPEYMIPARFGLLHELPTTVGGKLNRRALPLLDVQDAEGQGSRPPRGLIEETIALAFQQVLELADPVSIDQDFFNDLGGDSLLAALLVSRLRVEEATASLTVLDIYEARTVEQLATRVSPLSPEKVRATATDSATPDRSTPDRSTPDRSTPDRSTPGRPLLATLVQTLWLAAMLMTGASLVYAFAFQGLPWLAERLGLAGLMLLSPLFLGGGLVAYTVLTTVLTVGLKKLLIGLYQPLAAPIWGSFYVRNWIVQQAAGLIPWRFLEGTVFQHVILRALGARIGRMVHIHRGVNLAQGGWDLLDIGDHVTLSQDASVRLVELEDGRIIVGPIALEKGATLDIRAGLSSGSRMGENSRLTPLSSLPRGGEIPAGKCWSGIPAAPAGKTEIVAPPDDSHCMNPIAQGVVLIAARSALGLFTSVPMIALLALAVMLIGPIRALEPEALLEFALHGSNLLLALALVILSVPLSLIARCVAMRMLGLVSEGRIDRWSLAYVRVWLKTELAAHASRWLSGTLLWPVWLRCAGMKIGRGSEVGTIIDTLPELVEIGPETFFADGVYLGGPRIEQGRVTLARVHLGTNTFLGNHAVVLAGQRLPDDILIGVATVADESRITRGTSWFGQPPFPLPRREVVEWDRRLTHAPSWGRYLCRLFWELLRFTLPAPLLLLACAWIGLVVQAETNLSTSAFFLVALPMLELGFLASLCLIVLVLKWILLGRVKPGKHPLWSSWVSRWDFHYVVWDLYARGPLGALEGTLLLNWYLRGMGVRIGRNVALGSGFAHVVDPDMLELQEGATVNCLLQVHTFEDRVLKIDRAVVRRNATLGSSSLLLYGTDIGERTYVAPHSVVMKGERLLPERAYVGCPTRPCGR